MNSFFWIILSTFLVSLASFVGIFILTIREDLLKKILSFLVAFAAGSLMGSALLHLTPQALLQLPSSKVLGLVLSGFVAFFVMERILYWRHCHNGRCQIHPFVYLNLAGDGIHNFVDGLIIAAGFLSNFSLGLTTVLAIFFHEVSQEMGDFAILVYGGLSKFRALLLNFGVATAALLGGVVGYFFIEKASFSASFLLALAAGGFIYIAAVDLIPEISHRRQGKSCLADLIFFLLGVFLMYALRDLI